MQLQQHQWTSIGTSRAMSMILAGCSSHRVTQRCIVIHVDDDTTTAAAAAAAAYCNIMRSPRSRYFSTTTVVKGKGDPPIGLNGSIGFIGLGMMGAKMVQNLARSLPSQKLLVHDNNPVAVHSVINNSYDDDHVSYHSMTTYTTVVLYDHCYCASQL